MGAGRRIEAISEIRARMAAPVAAPHLARAPETAPNPAKVSAVGARLDGEGWKVALLAEGRILAALEPWQARALASDVAAMADVLEGAVL